METNGATVLPKQHRAKPAPGVDALSNRVVEGGYAADGQPSAALFFWSHTRFLSDFTFGLHPHEGFEIISFVLEGRTRHFDTKTDRWSDLRGGDVQIIRSGSGLWHREGATAGARVFQMWFDPGFDTALRTEPSYTDHPAAQFTARPVGDALVTDQVGGEGPVKAHTEGLSIRRVALPRGARAELDVGVDRFTLVHVLGGEAVVNGARASADDTVSLSGASAMTVEAADSADLFLVSLPTRPAYQPVRGR
ncbi:pirin family protein [Streptomyces sp. VNUA24]|uniref:pirin family protein n=1 Tax=Streptomyces sp. VNUA24 TaxID=3031131 RepID=UPI0023B7B193|nr:pirin family protein [Streptomyces sp. VNUA24]WEH13006.1 pirin family protein [Streptomyces sp. VNUA24]